jgi:hypothetical protein
VADRLPAGRRGQLAASVYDTPRAPSFYALSQVCKWLESRFSRLDLRVADPAFEVAAVPPGLVSSVTFVLPTANEATRLAALSRFMRVAPEYHRRRVHQGVGDVRTRRELLACLELGAPFITGPAVSELTDEPIRPAPWSAERLPTYPT